MSKRSLKTALSNLYSSWYIDLLVFLYLLTNSLMADWSRQEVQLVVADYLAMLADELAEKPYNKSAHRKMLLPLLSNRSEGSIEFKYQNISAALIEVGAVYIKGYLPRFNYQALLKEECIKQLEFKTSYWETAFTAFTDNLPPTVRLTDFSKILDTPPKTKDRKLPIRPIKERKPFKINYLEREQRNARSGNIGEQIAIAYERWRLIDAGKDSFADKIEWVSYYDDGAGFDILSKNENGSDRYIEVKSTKLGKETPIFFSNGEFEFAKRNSTDYHLYRVFNLTQHPRLFTANGDFDSFCQKEPLHFKGYI